MHLIALAALSVLACTKDDADDTGASGGLVTDQGLYALLVSYTPDPPVAGDTTLTVEIHDAATDELLTGSTLTVTPWMPDHGHGISDPPDVVEDAGVYTVTFAYSMPGTWELTFDVDGSLGVDSAVLTVEVE
ncbi:FixH family protein [Myxococcota bacterium]|nr:FixH family protein [Myxococcota bacterium]